MQTIELLNGPGAVLRHLESRVNPEADFLWIQRGSPRRPWEGFRQLVFQAEQISGIESVREILLRHPETAFLLLARNPCASPSDPNPSPPFVSDRAARLDSHLSHNNLVKRAFVQEALELLEALFGLQRIRVVIPDLATVDAETVWLLDRFLRSRAESFPSAIIGLGGQEWATPDTEGLLWGPSPLDLASLSFHLRRHPRTVLQETDEGGEASAASAKALLAEDRIGQDEERRILRCLKAESSISDETIAQERAQALVSLVRHAFASHAFEAALLWGLEVLARCSLEPLDEAEVHGIVALSAHNRQFRSRGNSQLPTFLEQHFRRALELETRPAWRSAHLYRLTVTLGRRQGRLEEAMIAADEAFSVADTTELPKPVSVYLQAWARNMRALLWVRSKDPARAVEDLEKAFEAIGEVRRKLPEEPTEIRAVWERDLMMSWNVLAGNRVGLARMLGDEEAVKLWQGREDAKTVEHPEFTLYTYADWIPNHRGFLHYDLALETAERGLEVARSDGDVVWEYAFLAQIGDLAYRLGQTEKAVEACAVAQEFAEDYGHAAFLGSLDLLHAEALARAGQRKAALERLAALLESSALSPSSLLEIHGLRARFLAEEGDTKGAEAAANAAIDIAVEMGDRRALVLAAVAAGAASDHLGRPEEALDAYSRARQIAAEEPSEVSAADLLEAHLGMWLHDPARADLVVEALRALPSALRHADGWWLLAPLAKAVLAVAREEPEQLTIKDLEEPLRQLALTGRQRQDAQPAVAALEEQLAAFE